MMDPHGGSCCADLALGGVAFQHVANQHMAKNYFADLIDRLMIYIVHLGTFVFSVLVALSAVVIECDDLLLIDQTLFLLQWLIALGSKNRYH